ncbi:hypothetical protein SAY87_031846 [Trapa incisa]|uniref:Myb-like domain-containing protein n=1 Tax=Trapa incisa TaxID=236973 RepID=A0AAN7KU12_9MYRT|nr:hypothetical protein SAY87_031846 [Trapa incisa]
MEGRYGQHHINPHHQQQQYVSSGVDPTGDRFPQWSLQETKDFLMKRAELDQRFMETKRNKVLWEVVSNKMKEMGYNRSADQCKSKWKNLVTRYKGCETMEAETMRQQFPFYNEIHSIFSVRMQRMLWAEGEGGGASSSSKKKASHQLSWGEEDEEEDSDGEQKAGSSCRNTKNKKKKVKTGASSSEGDSGKLVKLVEGFMRQQVQMEMQWREEYEEREKERRMREMEWRQTMEALEKERAMMDRRWREREEQRRIREDARAEKRDALITALLNKLRSREDSNM